MVKNSSGGGKNKKLARKLTTPINTKKEATRLSTNELEEYAIIKKIFGNGRCQTQTHSGLVIQCIIRNKFKGRSKRGNIISKGTYILVGLREWECSSGYKTCDLLEIYDNEDINVLNNQPLFKNLLKNTNEEDKEDGLFSCIEDSGFSETNETLPPSTIDTIIDDDLNFDDI